MNIRAIHCRRLWRRAHEAEIRTIGLRLQGDVRLRRDHVVKDRRCFHLDWNIEARTREQLKRAERRRSELEVARRESRRDEILADERNLNAVVELRPLAFE